ncbi:MAG: PCRF domain-containing protein, partial [Gammaproteobacteria bacterium]
MKQSLLNKLDNLSERLQELEALLSDPGVINDQNKFREYAKEHADIKPVVASFENYTSTLENIVSAKEMMN